MLNRLCLFLLAFSLAAPAQARPKVVVVSIDGFRPAFYQDPGWTTPTMRRLAREGGSAQSMLSVFPSITYVNHTSLVTGVRPGRHGIEDNLAFDWQRGPLPNWNWESARIRVPALWDRAAAAGLRSAALSWPVTVGARIDTLMPEIFHVDGANQETTEQLIRRYSTPGLLERRADAPVPITFEEWDRWMPGTFHQVWRQEQPDLCLLHMLNVDFTQHRHGLDSPETHRAVQVMDECLGQLLDGVEGQETTVLVVGDHGFAAFDQWVCPNRLFLDEGWLKLDERGKLQSWSVLAEANGGSAAIYCKDPSLEKRVLQALADRAGPAYEIWDRARLRQEGVFAGALAAVVARPGYAMRSDFQRPLCAPADVPAGQHGFDPARVPTGFLAWGRGVRMGADYGQIRVLDVAPTVCRLLGLDGAGMEGRALDL